MDSIIQEIYNNVLEGNRDGTAQKVTEALEMGVAPDVILNEGMVAAMSQVGALYEAGEYFVPEMLVCARAMKFGLGILRPHLVDTEVPSNGVVVIGTVKGDLHDIGKNLVGMMLEGAAFEVVDLGTDVSPEQIVSAVRDHQPQIVALSALLTTTMPNMEITIKSLEEAGVRADVRVIVGGAPVTPDYAESIGADGYAPDASRAVALTKSIIG
jgi:5-methyltetrahydrofolate--homocysteine methyltransferase